MGKRKTKGEGLIYKKLKKLTKNIIVPENWKRRNDRIRYMHVQAPAPNYYM